MTEHTVYLSIAENGKVKATKRKPTVPVSKSTGYKGTSYMPTALVKLTVDIPDEIFEGFEKHLDVSPDDMEIITVDVDPDEGDDE